MKNSEMIGHSDSGYEISYVKGQKNYQLARRGKVILSGSDKKSLKNFHRYISNYPFVNNFE